MYKAYDKHMFDHSGQGMHFGYSEVQENHIKYMIVAVIVILSVD